jgi:hypothetical protein
LILPYSDSRSSILLWTHTPLQFGPTSSIFYLSLPEQLTWVTFTLSAYQIGLPESCPDSLLDPHPNALYDRINVYSALYVHTWSNHLIQFFSRSDFYLPDFTRSYPTELPYPIFSWSDFYLPDRTRPPYPTSLPGRVILRCTFCQAVLHHVTFCGVTHAPLFLALLVCKSKKHTTTTM